MWIYQKVTGSEQFDAPFCNIYFLYNCDKTEEGMYFYNKFS